MVHDGDRAGSFYPKILTGFYVGSGEGNTQVISFERAGTPASIEILCAGRVTYKWIFLMGPDSCLKMTASDDCRWDTIADTLFDIGAGSFSVTGNLNANVEVYRYIVMWAD